MDLLASFESESFQTDTISYNAAIATCEQDLSWPTVPRICLAWECFVTFFAKVAVEKAHRFFPVVPPALLVYVMPDYSSTSSKKWPGSVSLKYLEIDLSTIRIFDIYIYTWIFATALMALRAR